MTAICWWSRVRLFCSRGIAAASPLSPPLYWALPVGFCVRPRARGMRVVVFIYRSPVITNQL